MCVHVLSSQPNIHPKVGLVSQEEFDSQRGAEDEAREVEETDGDMVFPLDLQEGGGGKTESQEPAKQAVVPTVVELKCKCLFRKYSSLTHTHTHTHTHSSDIPPPLCS